MPEIPLTTLFAVFVAAAMLFGVIWIAVSWWLERGRHRMAQRTRPADDSDPTILLDETYGRGARFPGWERFKRTAAERLERTELGLTPAEALAMTLFCGVVLAAVFFFWRYEAEESWMAIPAFLFGISVPLAFLAFRQRAWRRRLQDQLPDMLFLMSRSLRAGMSIDQSMAVLGNHGVAPLSREFARMHRQLDLGLAMHQVLRMAADRLRLVDFSVFASVLSLHRTTGGNLAVLMDRLAQTTRDHNQLRGHYRSTTALGRASTVLVLVMSVLLVSYLGFFHRDLAAHYFESLAGLTLFCVGVGLMVGAVILFYFFARTDDM
jgi:tight adherence protein B